jgi:predicted nucleic acid-binding protein
LIFDTDILVWLHRGHPGAARFVNRVPLPERNLSAISYLELLYGSRDTQDLAKVQGMVEDLFAEVVPISEGISTSASRIMRSYVLAHRPDVSDAVIGATALTRQEALATANLKHFRFIPGIHLRAFHP